MDIINSIISLGASVMMPVIFFIIALCFGVKIGTAFKAGMLVGIGFEGVGLGFAADAARRGGLYRHQPGHASVEINQNGEYRYF